MPALTSPRGYTTVAPPGNSTLFGKTALHHAPFGRAAKWRLFRLLARGCDTVLLLRHLFTYAGLRQLTRCQWLDGEISSVKLRSTLRHFVLEKKKINWCSYAGEFYNSFMVNKPRARLSLVLPVLIPPLYFPASI